MKLTPEEFIRKYYDIEVKWADSQGHVIVYDGELSSGEFIRVGYLRFEFDEPIENIYTVVGKLKPYFGFVENNSHVIIEEFYDENVFKNLESKPYPDWLKSMREATDQNRKYNDKISRETLELRRGNQKLKKTKSMTNPNQYSEKEKKLIQSLGFNDFLENDCPAPTMYDTIALHCFVNALEGPKVESIRNCVKAMKDGNGPKRFTKEFDYLIDLGE